MPNPASTPLLLLPMRIETRFVAESGGSSLLVRIYPDQVSLDAHDPELTAGELSAGIAFWTVAWRCGTNADDAPIRTAWANLVRTYRSPRAAWIVRQTTPANLAARPAAPTANDSAPSPAPAFPAPATRGSSLSRAALVRLLPDAWTVVVQTAAATATYRGTAIAADLAVSLDPGAPGGFPPGSTVDAGMQWLTDFDAAVAAGMALRIPLDATTSKTGFDALYVYGLRSQTDVSSDLAALFDAHHYSDGFALVPHGTPTNNTSDASSGWSLDDADATYAAEIAPAAGLAPHSDAAQLKAALGLAATAATLDRVVNASTFGRANGSDMLTALWPATLGYFLQQMMSPTFTAAQIDAARTWAIANAVPRGPFAALRTGTTPYGVLPVSALRFYAAPASLGASPEPAFVGFLKKLLPAWVTSAAGAPKIAGADPDGDLMNVLGLEASSSTFVGRELFGQTLLWNWHAFNGADLTARNAWFATLTNLAKKAIATYGSASWNPFLLSCAFNTSEFTIRFPTVTADPLSETDPIAPDATTGSTTFNYIAWLLDAAYADVLAENYPNAAKTPPATLLYKLLRQGLLREYADIASQREIADGRLAASAVLEPELIHVGTQAATTALDVLARPMPDAPGKTWGEFLSTAASPAGSTYARLGDLRASFARLAVLPTAELDRLFGETLDACSHRLDVWLTGAANAIFTRTRATTPSGLQAGGYGFVENVRPADASAAAAPAGDEVAAVSRLDALRAPQVRAGAVLAPPQAPAADNGGYILAPSYAQASAAAVLRAGYMSHLGTTSEPVLSVDLSSKRVRDALWLLDGVRGGQSASELLGYRFEEALDEQHLQPYVQPFRDRFPIVGTELTPTQPAAESVGASNVVDGLALRAAYVAKQFVAGASWGTNFPAPVATDQTNVLAAIAALDDIVDGLSDLSLSESVFQIISGNVPRAGGLLDAVSRGEYAPEPQVVQTPRAGVDLTQRVVALFGSTAEPAAAWKAIANHPRALAEPALDAWTSTLLPDPATVRCTVSAGTLKAVVSLADLDLGPLDFIAIAGAAPQATELEARIRYRANVAANAVTATITFDTTGLEAGTIGFPAALAAARSIGALIGSARPLGPSDLCEAAVDPASAGGAYASVELAARVGAALSGFDAALSAVQTASAGLPDSAGAVRSALIECAAYGVVGIVPAIASGPDASLGALAAAAIGEMQKRRALVTIAPAAVDDCIAAANALFANSVTVLPRAIAPNATTFAAAFGVALVPAALADAPSAWLQQLTHVRDGIARFDEALTLAELLTSTDRAPLQLAQLPPTPGDRWLGLPLDPETAPPASGRVAFAAIVSGNVATSSDFAGLVIDEWPERIPSAVQTAAVAFHFDEPKSRAPQALLLAVCPDARAAWDDELLLATLEDTLQLAKVRSVDLDSLIDVGQILPAAYVPLNLQQATIAARFRMTATEAAQFHASGI